ncbi:hypothetical protein Lalb_Chr06g0171141 [Lupinus albus]|uniref:Uncharacterized protein n=1 Tax=Lupinus albus TaxID=3870 RepID=A0A6A4QGA4_LUPAL|nr:hypothetical protein Lalb_Chr06g0171141 [Lupinus albus]
MLTRRRKWWRQQPRFTPARRHNGSRSMVVSRESKGGDGKGVSHGMFVSRLVKGKIQGDIGEK